MTTTPVSGSPRTRAAWRAGFERARMFGVSALWSVRGAGGLPTAAGARHSCLQRLHVVDVLMCLPLNDPIRETALTARQRRILGDAPSDVVDRSDEGWLTRRATEPLHVDHVVVPSRTFRRGLELASTFAGYCTRSMALPSGAQVSMLECAEASYFGVGVYRSDGAGSVEELLAPETFPLLPDTAASWVFAEQLHAQLVHTGRRV